MKIIKNVFDKYKPLFEQGGKFEKLMPFFGTFETLFFVPDEVTPLKGAQIRDAVDLKRLMMTVIIAMVPALLFGIWNVGYQHELATGEVLTFATKMWIGAIVVLPIVVVSYATGLGVEFVFGIKKGHALNEGFLVT
ncbi:MAG: RnfABCDGE type electron transport complex subunit D, partial [Cyclobacteriaceae bacterium]|nr:RnfABCDGE type electron transport complex subunit D [Cyclobacteriaceae bacterium]